MNVNLRIFGKEVFSAGVERRSISDLKNPKDWLLNMMGGGKVAGQPINQNSALTFSGYYGSVKILMETMGILPVGTFSKDGNIRKAIDHPAAHLLSVKPNAYQTPQLFHETLMGYACNRGNGYARIVKDSQLNPVALVPFENQADVYPVLYENELFYKVSGEMDMLMPRDIYHIRGLGFDGYRGVSLMQVAASVIGGALASQQYSNDVHSSGGAQRTALVIPNKVDDAVEKKIKRDWALKYGEHSMNKNEVALLQAGMDIKQIGMSLEDAQLIESKKLSIQDFSRFTRIPLHMLNDIEKSGYNSLEHLSKEFVTYTMEPWLVRFTQEANAKLYRETQKNEFYTEYSTTNLTKGDSEAQANLISKLFPTGAISPDEIRERIFNLNPRGDERGKTYYTAVNVHTDTHAQAKEELVKTKIKEASDE